ncbi:MAG TPA: hypothetical protein VHB51_00280 [Candidatus Saccharimonadales bacterium]|nr:hypothetical protein [Candidatus Saccharimonadales bacterium]
MLGGQNKQPRGYASPAYTIIEVMIFLAVSGMMFVSAAIFINGKQASVEFRQGMVNANASIQAVVNQVSNGEYPSLGDFTCRVNSPSDPASQPTFTSDVGGNNAQGANGGSAADRSSSGCIFLGKVVQFDPNDSGLNATNYYVYSVAGRQFNKEGDPANSFAEAQPQVVFNASPAIDLTEQHALQDGLEFAGAYLCTEPTSCDAIGAIGFFGSFNGGAVSNNQGSGSQTVTTAVIPGVPAHTTKNNAIAQMDVAYSTAATSGMANIANNPNPDLFPTPPKVIIGGKYILLCFNNGRNRKGALTIGGTGGQQFTTALYFNISTTGVEQKCQ